MTRWELSQKRHGPKRRGAIVQLQKKPEPSNAKMRILYGGYTDPLRSKIIENPSWRNAMIAKVTESIRSYWDRRIAEEGNRTDTNPIGGEPVGSILPNASIPELFKELDGAETVVLFGHVKVVRVKETATVMSTLICLYTNKKRHTWLSPDEVVAMLPMSVRSVYILGCRSDPFADRLASKRAGLKVFGIAADTKVYEHASDVEAPASYEIFLYPETAKKGQESFQRKEIYFDEHIAGPSLGL